LEIAREFSAVFDRYHLGVYVEALILANREDEALPLLEDALQDRPDDQRLNYRMAEILRKRGQYEEATVFAEKARNLGAPKAHLTLANTAYSQAQECLQSGEERVALEYYRQALRALEEFRPEFGHDQEVADGIAAKVYRSMGDWDHAKLRVSKYKNTHNTFTIYEQCLIDIHESDQATVDGRYSEALGRVQNAVNRLESYDAGLPQPLAEVLAIAKEKESQLESCIKDWDSTVS
jgi:tetratricopeptide (TPR) repeat protein